MIPHLEYAGGLHWSGLDGPIGIALIAVQD